MGKKREKSGKSGKKEEKSGRNGKNREIFFTLPLLTDRAGYATALTDNNSFLPKSPTSDALTTTLHEWYGHLEGRKSIAMALFDLSKAFDRRCCRSTTFLVQVLPFL